MPRARTALLIATDTYADSAFGQLRAPQHDVTALAEVLRDKEIGDFHVEALINKPSHEIRVRINELFQQARRNDLVLLYISGHGIKDEPGRLHFASTDTRRGLLASTAIPALWIRELMDHSLARQVVLWLDCCYGGAFPAGMIPKAATVDVVPQLTPQGRGSAVMTASTHVQFAFEGDHRVTNKTRPSLFTSAIVEGLRTGDADRNGDGEIDVHELYSYVHEQVTRATPNQTPTRNDQLTGDIYIAHSRRGDRLHSDLPAEIRQALRSPRSVIRLGAVEMLFGLAKSPDRAEQTMARTTLSELSTAHDRTLAAAAFAAIERLDGPPPAPDPVEPAARLELPNFGRRADLLIAILLSAFAVVSSVVAADKRNQLNEPISAGVLAVVGLIVFLLAVRLFAQVISGTAVLPTDSANTTDIAFRPDAHVLVCGGEPGAIWNTGSWSRQTDTIQIGHQVAFSPNGAMLVTARTSHIWVLDRNLTGQVAKLAVRFMARSLAFSPDGSVLAATSLRQVSIWRTSDWQLVESLHGHTDAVSSLAFSPTVGLLASVSDDRTVKLWNTHDWTLYRTLTVHNHPVRGVTFSPSGHTLITSDRTKLIFWDTEEWSSYRTIRGNAGVLAINPAGDRLAVAGSGGGIKLIDLKGHGRRTLVGHRLPVTALAFSPHGELLASASRDGTVRLWPIRRQQTDSPGLR